jgi:subtilase family serine protease
MINNKKAKAIKNKTKTFKADDSNRIKEINEKNNN